MPTDGFRVGDSTFERVYGKRVYDAPLIESTVTGSYFVEGNLDLKAQLAAEETGPREQSHIGERLRYIVNKLYMVCVH